MLHIFFNFVNATNSIIFKYNEKSLEPAISFLVSRRTK